MEDITYRECQHEYIVSGICQGDNCQLLFIDPQGKEVQIKNLCVGDVDTKNA